MSFNPNAKINDVTKEDNLLKELCAYFQQIGVKATMVDSENTEAIKGFVAFSIGSVKIDGQNIDHVQIEKSSEAGTQPTLQPGQTGYTNERALGSLRYDYHYAVQGKVEGSESKLEAEFKPIEKRKGLFGKEVVGFEWKGGELAQRLNSDRDLHDILLKEGLHQLLVKPEKNYGCVRITPQTGPAPVSNFDFGNHRILVGQKAFPSRQAFDAYDKIAQHVTQILAG